jgi:hypothetical protein
MSKTKETLAQAEMRFISRMSPSDEAKRLAPKLIEEAVEARHRARLKEGMGKAHFELDDLAAVRLERAAELLRILEQEQFRQRTAAAIHLDGRMSTSDLRQVTRSWNGDKPKPKAPCAHPDDGGCGECSE